MLPLHPPSSGLPLAFLLLLLALEVKRSAGAVAFKGTVIWALVAGNALAFFSGYQASANAGMLSPASEAALSSHHAWGRLLLINSALVGLFYWVSRIAIVNKQAFVALYYLFLVLQTGLTVWVGSLGGALVFEHGVGVKTPDVEALSASTTR